MSPRQAVRSLCFTCVIGLLTGCGGGQATKPPSAPATVAPAVLVEATSVEFPREAAPAAHAEAEVPVSADDPMWGNPLAPVTVVTFIDFECPFSARLQPTLRTLQDEYGPSRLRIVFKHLPLPFHHRAKAAAMAAEAVRAAGGNRAFWAFRARIFEERQSLDDANFEAWAAEAGVGLDSYRMLLAAPATAEKVERDIELASELGVVGAPTSFINGIMVPGAQPIEQFRAAFDPLLERARELQESGVEPAELYVAMTKEGYEPPEPEEDSAEPAQDTTVWLVPLGQSPTRGARNALVTIVMFGDYQCPYCARANITVLELLKLYPTELRVVWKDRALPFHQRAMPAALIAREARRQKGDDGFWRAHDKLFENYQSLQDEDLERYAAELGLNRVAARRALAGNDQTPFQHDEVLAERLKVAGTPHFFINGRRLVGAQPLEKFRELIDEELLKAREVVKTGTPASQVYAKLQQNALAAPERPPAPPPERKAVPLPTANQPWRGGRNAKVVIQQFSEFQCPFCSRVEPTIDELRSRYGDRIKFVWRHLPLPFHNHAQLAAEASVEAFRQLGNDGFWSYQAKVFEHQRDPGGLERPALEQYAREVGLDLVRFRNALDTHAHAAVVQADLNVAKQAGIHGTPSFVINGYFVSGAQPLENFVEVIDLALKEAR